jgi:GNAT superfamily N-acetyltransferase
MSAGDALSASQFSAHHSLGLQFIEHRPSEDSIGRATNGKVDMGPDVWDSNDHVWGGEVRQTQGVRVSHSQPEPGYHVFSAHSPAFYDEDTDGLSRIHYGRLGVEHVPGVGHVIHEIEVAPDHQMSGVGTALYDEATRTLGKVHHSTVKTDAGRAWAQKVGGPQESGTQYRHQY